MTPLDKQEKIAKSMVSKLTNRIKVEFSTHKINTLGDYLLALGHSKDEIKNTLHYRDNELNQNITFKELKERLDDLRIEVDTRYWLLRNPPLEITYDNTKEVGDNERKSGADASQHSDKDSLNEDGDNKAGISTKTVGEVGEDTSLPASNKEKCTLFWFQKRDAKKLLDGITIHNRRAQMLVANAGYGKTFILGALIRRLLDIEFLKGKTVSPWPIFYVTKATVVEQTKRVLTDKFSIDTIDEVVVTNYDQLRATLGTLFLEEKTIIEAGIPYRKWVWKPIIHPIIFIFDESQSAKNNTSTQSEITIAVHKIESPHVYCIFSSATPFTRISEAQYFVLNARIDDKLF
jgi:hypothetical protein